MSELTSEQVNQTKSQITYNSELITYYSLPKLEKLGLVKLDSLPFSIRILLENVLRNFDDSLITVEDISTYSQWPEGVNKLDVPFMPARTVLQDFTGVPLLVDLANMREAMHEHGGDPQKINPVIPTDLVIDHSVQVDYYGSPNAFNLNLDLEYQRNTERYQLIKWAQQSFKQMRIIPPGSGIVHQINLEYLSPLVDIREFRGVKTAVIDTIVGTDSHTPMINGLGVVGWGVGGIEAEAVMLGLPYFLLLPEVIGVKIVGSLPEGTTATDVVLTVTELLRKEGVVGKFVEYFGPSLSNLSVTDRATLSNMVPEYGATIGYFPVDEATLSYMKFTGRDPDKIKFIERYLKQQRLFRSSISPDPVFTKVVELDLNSIEPSLAGPRNPEERVSLFQLKNRVNTVMDEHAKTRHPPDSSNPKERIEANFTLDGHPVSLKDGDIVIASITSCTNTSNPPVLVGAGLLAKNAVEKGLQVKPYVKTSFGPGSLVVEDYMKELKLQQYLDKLGFHVVGRGCLTCIGNSGKLKPEIEQTIKENDLYVTSVLSGNRNFAGRVHQLTRGNFLASPMLVVAYALSGTTNIDLTLEPLGLDHVGNPVYLKDIWPSQQEIQRAIEAGIRPEMFKNRYGSIMDGDLSWQNIEIQSSIRFPWSSDSTYIRKPPYFDGYKPEKSTSKDIFGARVLVLTNEKVSTDHISPAGAIAKESPAGKYLKDLGVKPMDFNTYGSRRGNHEVMVRGTFGNIRLRNQLVPGKEGWWTLNHLTGEISPIFDTAMNYINQNIPTIILGVDSYGRGSSRDYAAKGPLLQGVKAVIVKDFERIHRSNLIGMGILPMTFKKGKGWEELGLDGTEIFDITGLEDGVKIGMEAYVTAHKADTSKINFIVDIRLDTEMEIDFFLYGGIMPYIVSKEIEKSL